MMSTLTLAHGLIVLLWTLLIVAHCAVEYRLWRTSEAEAQDKLMEKARMLTVLGEVPLILLGVASGIGLLWAGEYLSPLKKWPVALEEKLTVVTALLSCHALHVFCVLMRSWRADAIFDKSPPLKSYSVQIWHFPIPLTAMALPFACLAAYLSFQFAR